MRQSVLDQLISASPYFNSHELLLHWMSKCEQRIQQLESIVGQKLVSTFLSRISREDYAFIVRCTHFRMEMKKLEYELNSRNTQLKALLDSYKYLVLIFRSFDLNQGVPRDAALQTAGYDMEHAITGPYPLVVSLIADNGHNCATESESIKEFFAENKFGIQYNLENFSAEEIGSLKMALQELNSISPYLLCDVTMNVRLFGKIRPKVVDPKSKHVSFTTSYLPGACFFSDGAFTEHERVGECIFHEALHMKYLQTIEVYYIHPRAYTGDTGRKFICSWRSEGNIWSFNRAFGAFHVYSHLYVYYCELLKRRPPSIYNLTWVASRLEKCRVRTAELRKWVESEKEEAFTNEGISYFESICKAIDSA